MLRRRNTKYSIAIIILALVILVKLIYEFPTTESLDTPIRPLISIKDKVDTEVPIPSWIAEHGKIWEGGSEAITTPVNIAVANNEIPNKEWIENGINFNRESQDTPTIVNMKEEVNTDTSWIDYRNNWDGEILIKSDLGKLTLTDEYREAMRRKGAHPLIQLYPKLLNHTNSIRDNCLKIPGSFSNVITQSSGIYFYNDDYEVVYCAIAKASSTMWGKRFALMVGPIEDVTQDVRRRISLSSIFSQPLKAARNMQTYTKFFIYRHPFERMISGYCDKFTVLGRVWYLDTYGKNIITANYLLGNTHGQELSPERKEEITKQTNRLKLRGNDLNITFREFATWVASFLDRNSVQQMDEHWKPISLQCNPCAVDYDVIIDHDFVVEESQLLIDYLQKNKESNPHINFVENPRESSRDKCNEYFRDIPQNIREKLHKVYLNDFILFGYSYNGDNQDYACEEKTTE